MNAIQKNYVLMKEFLDYLAHLSENDPYTYENEEALANISTQASELLREINKNEKSKT